MKNNKATGFDGTQAEAGKVLSTENEGIGILTGLFNQIKITKDSHANRNLLLFVRYTRERDVQMNQEESCTISFGKDIFWDPDWQAKRLDSKQ
jgi:hypothetical protein